MTPQLLQRHFIGISMIKSDYAKVRGLLPAPSYMDIYHSYQNQSVVLIYVLDGYITSYLQYKWISNIKLGLNDYLCVPFNYEDIFYITDTTDITNCIYTINELSIAFKAKKITYPKIMYPSTKKDLYKHLCWYGKRLIHQKVFTKEGLISTALLMNSKLQEKYNYKETHKKVLGAYSWLVENQDGFSVKLSQSALKQVHAKGAKIKNSNQADKTKRRIKELLKDDRYIKHNGKVNKTRLAKDLNMNRRTMDNYF